MQPAEKRPAAVSAAAAPGIANAREPDTVDGCLAVRPTGILGRQAGMNPAGNLALPLPLVSGALRFVKLDASGLPGLE